MLKSADTEVLSFAEDTLEVWAFVPEGEFRGLLTNTTNDKSCGNNWKYRYVLRETSPQAELTILLHVNVWNQVNQFLWLSPPLRKTTCVQLWTFTLFWCRWSCHWELSSNWTDRSHWLERHVTLCPDQDQALLLSQGCPDLNCNSSIWLSSWQHCSALNGGSSASVSHTQSQY